jgi:hypothetical protein
VPAFLAETCQACDIIPEPDLPDLQAGFFEALAKSFDLRALPCAIDARKADKSGS